jgi:prevent-host-death family protein
MTTFWLSCDYMEVGIRELKAKLSAHVQRAAEGATIIVTDRGRPVARLVAYNDSSAIERGITEGWIEPARRSKLSPTRRYPSARAVLDILDDDRS